MTRKIVKTIDLTDYDDSLQEGGFPTTVVRLLSDTENEHMDGIWEAETDLRGGLPGMCGYGDTPEAAVRELVGNLKGYGGFIFKKANDLLGTKIPKSDKDPA